ncbi:MAG: mechanosensitive ion channel [Chlorobi bacterium]|nr:mechanosensitive ion channel [Chlorobiota bacterium]
MNDIINTIKQWTLDNPILGIIVKIAGILLLAYITYWIVHKVLIRYITKFVKKTKTEFDDILLNEKILKRVSYIVPVLVIQQFKIFNPSIESIVDTALSAVLVLLLILIVNGVIDALTEIVQQFEKFKDRPLKSYAQVIKIIVTTIGVIFIFGILTGQEFWGLFAGLGAISAVLLFVFKDTIMSFIASIQIATYDLVKIGDWIEIPKLGIDGDIMDISLHTVKIRNFDKTVSVFPTVALIQNSFKNWRGMQETGGRRIKRSIYIDVSSIEFVDDKMLQRFKKIKLISNYLDKKIEEINNYNSQLNEESSDDIANGRRITNVGTFRQYLKEYLRERSDVDKNLTFLVRQLQPGPEGLPIEIYIFATTTEWVKYEDIQSDIFDHIMAVVPQFELKVFQNPTSYDFKELSKIKTGQNNISQGKIE